MWLKTEVKGLNIIVFIISTSKEEHVNTADDDIGEIKTDI